jgi:serine/threonine-protein kinase
VKLQHEFIPEKLARGKFYDLLHVSQSNRSAFVEHLTRHARVCERIGLHPNIAENLTVHPVLNQEGWWVIDKWISGESLEDLVNGGKSFTPREVRSLGRGILSGLRAMHDKQVVFRELAPDKVHLLYENSQVLLTDFEMAKLADGSPSVSHLWEPSYFRAPELGESDPSGKVDLYAFARVLLWITSKGNTKVRQFEKSRNLPLNIAKVLNACLETLASKRPASVEAVQKVWDDWK